MVEIKRLTTLDPELLKQLITGYVAHEKYIVRRVEEQSNLVFTLELVNLAQPYVKQYDHLDAATIDHYRDLLQWGFSMGAYAGEQLVGVALAAPQAWNNSLWVYELHVAEGQRRRGVGWALIGRLVEQARAARCRVIVCETQNTNTPAIRFYRKMGFVIAGLDLSYYSNDDWPDGEIAVFMKRKL